MMKCTSMFMMKLLIEFLLMFSGKKTELIKRNKPTTFYNQAQHIIYQDFIKIILMLLNQNSKMNAELKKFVWPVGCISYNINIS